MPIQNINLRLYFRCPWLNKKGPRSKEKKKKSNFETSGANKMSADHGDDTCFYCRVDLGARFFQPNQVGRATDVTPVRYAIMADGLIDYFRFIFYSHHYGEFFFFFKGGLVKKKSNTLIFVTPCVGGINFHSGRFYGEITIVALLVYRDIRSKKKS